MLRIKVSNTDTDEETTQELISSVYIYLTIYPQQLTVFPASNFSVSFPFPVAFTMTSSFSYSDAVSLRVLLLSRLNALPVMRSRCKILLPGWDLFWKIIVVWKCSIFGILSDGQSVHSILKNCSREGKLKVLIICKSDDHIYQGIFLFCAMGWQFSGMFM